MSRAEIDKSPQEIGIKALAKEVDEKATTRPYEVAEIQVTRHEIQKEKRDRGSRAYPLIGDDRTEIFDDSSIGDDFAYHYGGRHELQFNLKIRKYDGVWRIRHGAAFRLQPGHTKNRDIEKPIQRRVKLFNQYLEEHREEFRGLGMCYSITEDNEKIPSRLFRPHKIPVQLLGEEITVVLGKREKPSDLTYDDILSLYDELLPLYKYIERNLEPEDSFDPDSFSPPSNTVQESRIAFGVEETEEDSLHEHPEEETTPEIHEEGSTATVEVNRYERSEAARKACLEHYGAVCQVCGLRFEERYGEIGEGFIEVHHEVPLSESKGVREVDPIDDLKPVCPNCHAMLHQESTPLSIEELRERLRI